MDYDWLRSFESFATHLNFTHAARALGLTQPAVHNHVRRLAEAFAVTLYRRQGRSLVLTDEGLRVLSYAREQRRREEQFRALLAGETPRLDVTLCAGVGAQRYLLGAALKAFMQQHPGRLRLLAASAEQSVEWLRRGEVELAVTALPRVPQGLSATSLLQSHAAVAMPRRHPLAKSCAADVSLKPSQLDDVALIVPPLGRPQRTMLERFLDAENVNWRAVAEARDWSHMLHLVKLGVGLAVVNDFCQPPAGVVLRRLTGIPSIRYQLLRRGELSDAAKDLQLLIERSCVAR